MPARNGSPSRRASPPPSPLPRAGAPAPAPCRPAPSTLARTFRAVFSNSCSGGADVAEGGVTPLTRTRKRRSPRSWAAHPARPAHVHRQAAVRAMDVGVVFGRVGKRSLLLPDPTSGRRGNQSPAIRTESPSPQDTAGPEAPQQDRTPDESKVAPLVWRSRRPFTSERDIGGATPGTNTSLPIRLLKMPSATLMTITSCPTYRAGDDGLHGHASTTTSAHASKPTRRGAACRAKAPARCTCWPSGADAPDHHRALNLPSATPEEIPGATSAISSTCVVTTARPSADRG